MPTNATHSHLGERVTAASIVFALALVMVPATAQAQQADLPPVLSRAFALLQADSLEAATRLWARTWTSPADSGKAEAILDGMRRTREMAGAFRGYDVIRTEAVSPHLKRTYVLMLYERVPVYGQFLMYNPGANPAAWQMQTVNWNTEVDKVWPASMWSH
jgi:hypothetical protein